MQIKSVLPSHRVNSSGCLVGRSSWLMRGRDGGRDGGGLALGACFCLFLMVLRLCWCQLVSTMSCCERRKVSGLVTS